MLIRDGVYAGLPNDEQQYRFGLIFALASAAALLSQLPMGFVLDWIGPRATVLVASVLTSLGCALMAVSDGKAVDYFLIGYLLLGWAGPSYVAAGVSLANLFPSYRGAVLSLFPGSFNVSAAVFLVFDLLSVDHFVSRRTLFLGLGAVSLFVAVVGWRIYPPHPVVLGDRARWSPWTPQYTTAASSQAVKTPINSPGLLDAPISVQYRSGAFWGLTAFHSLSILRLSFAIGTMREQLEQKGDEGEWASV